MAAVGALLILVGVVGVFAPRLIRLPNRWAALGIVVVGIVLAAAGSGGGAQPATPTQADTSATSSGEQGNGQGQSEQPSQEAASPASIGDPVQAGDLVLTVTKVERSNGNEYNRPDSGKVFLFVNVRLENKGQQTVSYNMFDAKIRDSNGNIQSNDFAASVALENRPKIESGELAPGGKVEGWLGFQVPKDDNRPVLIWEHGLFGSRQVEVVLAE